MEKNAKKSQVSQSANGRNNLKIDDGSIILKNNEQYFTIKEFASSTPYYSDILYQIMSKLRVYLNIGQKVELNEEKLRQYFRYWL